MSARHRFAAGRLDCEEQRRIVAERIEAARAQGGPYSKDLIEALTVLAELDTQSGIQSVAGTMTEQAMEVIRPLKLPGPDRPD